MVDISINDIIEQVFGISMTLGQLRRLNVRPEAKDEITRRICETKCASHILEFATQMPGLSEENLTDLTKAIIETGAIEEVCDFTREVTNLTAENDENLLQSIFENNSGIQKKKIA